MFMKCKNSRRVLAMIMALSLSAGAFVGCGDTKSSSVAETATITAEIASDTEINSMAEGVEVIEEVTDDPGEDIDVDEYIANVLDDGVEEGEDLKPVNEEDIDQDEMTRAGVGYTNSRLVEYTRISPNRSVPRNHKIDTITIHCMAGQLSVETCGNVYASSKAQASSNYGVGKDGRIALYVEEKDRSWCSSNSKNDNRAVTIEVASDSFSPYAVSDKAYEATIRLVADICRRNGIKKLIWSSDKSTRINHSKGANMTVHRDFANKACPGDYLYSRMGDIAKKVNAILAEKSKTEDSQVENSKTGNSQTKKTNDTSTLPYLVKVTSSGLNVYKNPDSSSSVVTAVKKGEVYTIVEERIKDNVTYGRLKSNVGWIDLSRTVKV